MKIFQKIGAVCWAALLVLSLAVPAFASEYTVVKGDSLWKIAKEKLGSGAKWGEIYEANQNVIKDPNRIYIGQRLTIPDGQAAPVQPAKPGLPGIAGTYTFTEAVMGGAFTVEWTLTLNEDGTFILTETNAMLGTTAYTGETYTAEGLTLTTGPLSGGKPQAVFFNDDLSCVWTLDPMHRTVTPAKYDAGGGDAPAPGLPSPGGKSDADFPNVSYASNSGTQICDIYRPEGVKQAPVIVLVHGGGFAFGDQGMDIIRPVIKAGLAHGYAVVSVDYRKSSEAVFPAALADVKAAVRFVRANAEKYGFDPDHIAVWGESAGAYLSLMTALTPDVAELNGDVTDNAGVSNGVTALVSFYAPVEFYTMYEEAGKPESAADSFESKFLGQDITADKTATYATYWETYKDQIPTDLKAWIQAGDSDHRVPCTQSSNFAQRLAEYLGEENVEHDLIPGADHEDATFYTDENLSAVFSWLDECLKG